MKTLTFICFFLFLSINILSQEIKIDSANYRAYSKNEFNSNTELIESQRSSALFRFRDDLIETTLYGQQKRFYIIDKWESDIFPSGHIIKIAQARDAGGFHLAITIGYEESKNDYFLILAYKNISQFFEIKEEEVPPAHDANFMYTGDPDLPIYEGFGGPDYTYEEIIEILNHFGNSNLIMMGVVFNIPILITTTILLRQLSGTSIE